MTGSNMAISAGTALKRDPIGSGKVVLFVALAILLLVVLWKVLKGFGKATELIGDLAPATESEKQDILTSKPYQEGVKALDEKNGIIAIVKAGYKNPSTYLAKKGISDELLSKAADQIWSAKMPFYMNATEVQSAISGLPSKAAIALMAGRFNYMYGNKWNGLPLAAFLTKYLSVKEMQTLTEIIYKKPNT